MILLIIISLYASLLVFPPTMQTARFHQMWINNPGCLWRCTIKFCSCFDRLSLPVSVNFGFICVHDIAIPWDKISKLLLHFFITSVLMFHRQLINGSHLVRYHNERGWGRDSYCQDECSSDFDILKSVDFPEVFFVASRYGTFMDLGGALLVEIVLLS